ncbi:hypothetical protein [Burkholderia ubonensis]|uniref:hypothetical protein n=1 Tax=Burkholderia ubonensis TaxID=101571 RepID=UPI000AA2C42D|nr:hypothetical protein [Burkholderia ubonensis]
MLDPNFSESQLQSAANLAYADEVRKRTGGIPYPFVPSLPAEYLLGWDTAYDLDWIRHRLSGPFADRHKGCNFFLQYKLSSLIDNPTRSKEWAAWGKPYFRFQIPHKKKIGKLYRNDFHQWERLKEIAAIGAPTFYATNTMIEESELRTLFEGGRLLDRIALLDVAPIKRKHIHASCADPFSKFALHSTPEEARILSFREAVASLSNVPKYSYEQGVEQLLTIAESLLGVMFADETSKVREQSSQLQQLFSTYTGRRRGLPQLKRTILESFFARRFGLTVYWYPAAE